MSKGKFGYFDPKKSLENRITDIGPQHFGQFLPPVIKRNYGKWAPVFRIPSRPI